MSSSALRSALRDHPLASAADLCHTLGISRPTLSRWLQAHSPDVIVVRRSRSNRYAWRRPVPGVEQVVPVVEMPRSGRQPRHLADLHPALPNGFVLQAHDPQLTTGWHDSLPWFLQSLRPSGWLGRQIPQLHPELRLPHRTQDWSHDHALRYLVEHGYDGIGALVVGQQALRRALDDAPTAAVDRHERLGAYTAAADAALQRGPAGSSAGGEHPKLLALRDDGGGRRVPVLVKFSPAAQGEISTRLRDLLICEHHALRVLNDHGQAAARSELLMGQHRTFLEVERFDREATGHRIGQITLGWVDAEFVGSTLTAWTDTTEALVRQGLLSAQDHAKVRWLVAFGHLIANTDMHPHNLSLRLSGARIEGLMPAYDMLPMAYAPVATAELRSVSFAPRAPEDAEVAAAVVEAAVDLWTRVAVDPRVSDDFREIAAKNAALVAALSRPSA